MSKNKPQPLFQDYPSHSDLLSMYKCVVVSPHKDVRVVFTTLHLVLEIALKKLAIHYGIPISTRSHKLGGLFYHVSHKDVIIRNRHTDLQNKGVLVRYQQFPYDELRFHAHLSPTVLLPDYEEFQQLITSVLQRLRLVELYAEQD